MTPESFKYVLSKSVEHYTHSFHTHTHTTHTHSWVYAYDNFVILNCGHILEIHYVRIFHEKTISMKLKKSNTITRRLLLTLEKVAVIRIIELKLELYAYWPISSLYIDKVHIGIQRKIQRFKRFYCHKKIYNLVSYIHFSSGNGIQMLHKN